MFNPPDNMDDLKQVRKRKKKKVVVKTPLLSRVNAKGDIAQCIYTLTEVAELLIETRQEGTPAIALDKHMKTAIDILKQTEQVEVARPFWVSAMEVLENDAKRTQWLHMPKAVRLSWMTKQVDRCFDM